MFRKILTDILSQAMEASNHQRTPVDLFDLAPPAPRRRVAEEISDEARPRPRDVEVATDDERRKARPRAAAPIGPARLRGDVTRREIVQVLKSPAGIRQALVLQEILGPPRSLRGWDEF